MARNIHTIKVPDGALPSLEDRVVVGVLSNVANAAGGGAGEAVSVAVGGFADLPANYAVLVSPGQDATWFVSAKSAAGFTVTLNPRLAAGTLAAGSFDVVVVA